jgi:hypothetical protein
VDATTFSQQPQPLEDDDGEDTAFVAKKPSKVTQGQQPGNALRHYHSKQRHPVNQEDNLEDLTVEDTLPGAFSYQQFDAMAERPPGREGECPSCRPCWSRKNPITMLPCLCKPQLFGG